MSKKYLNFLCERDSKGKKQFKQLLSFKVTSYKKNSHDFIYPSMYD